MTHEPGDLPFAVVTRPDGVRRSIRDLPKDDDRADRVSGRHVVTKAKAETAKPKADKPKADKPAAAVPAGVPAGMAELLGKWGD